MIMTTPKRESILSKIHKVIEQSKPKLKKNGRTYKAASVLLAAHFVGPDKEKIANLLGYRQSFMDRLDRNLRANQIWKDDTVYASDWDIKDINVGFWLDVQAALGSAERVWCGGFGVSTALITPADIKAIKNWDVKEGQELERYLKDLPAYAAKANQVFSRIIARMSKEEDEKTT